MSIFPSQFALTGVIPTQITSSVALLEPRAVAAPVGPALWDEDTTQFEQLHDSDRCYLKWCVKCYPPALSYTADCWHEHSGVEKVIEVEVAGLDGRSIGEGTVRMFLERLDDDKPGAPVTGQTRLFFDAEQMSMPLDAAMRVMQTAIGLIQVGIASESARNTNEVEQADLDAAVEAVKTRVAEAKAKNAADAAAKAARPVGRPIRWYQPAVFRVGQRLGERVERCFPRLADFIAYGRIRRIRIEPFHTLRLGFTLGRQGGRR
jgi:hypothetical protein